MLFDARSRFYGTFIVLSVSHHLSKFPVYRWEWNIQASGGKYLPKVAPPGGPNTDI